MKREYYHFKEDDAIRFARDRGLGFKTSDNELIFAKCPYCGETTDKKNKFSINLSTGQFQCFRASCGAKGNMITLSKDFDFSLGREIDEYYRPSRRFFKPIKKEIVSADPAIEYMKSRGISENVTRRYSITSTDDGNNNIVFPFIDENGDIVFIKYRNPSPKEGESKEWSQRSGKPILFGMNQCNMGNKTLIITEGQIDSLSVAECGIENAVSVPTGANGFTWIPYCWEWVNNFDKIIVFGDYEKNHITLYNDILQRWHDKTWRVQESDYLGCKDANEILQKYGPDQIKQCIENAIQEPLSGIIDISEVDDIEIDEIEKIPTGIRSLDHLLSGGFPLGSLIILTGKAGEGKSTLGSQFVINAIDKGYKCFMYSGELGKGTVKSWLLHQAAGKENTYQDSMYDDFKVKEDIKSAINSWLTGYCKLYDVSLINDDETEDLTKVVEECILRYGIQFILLDNLMTGINLESSDSYNIYDNQSSFIKKLTRIAVKYNVVILLVAHKRKDNYGTKDTNESVSGSRDITNLASIIISYEIDNSNNNENVRLLKLTKNRNNGRLDKNGTYMCFEWESKRIYQTELERVQEYSWVQNYVELPWLVNSSEDYIPGTEDSRTIIAQV